MTGAPLWIPACAGMTKKDQSPRCHGFPSFSQNVPRHSREGGNHSDPHWGSFLESTESSMPGSIFSGASIIGFSAQPQWAPADSGSKRLLPVVRTYVKVDFLTGCK